MSLNKVILCGRLGKDPEVKQVSSGTLVGQLALATTHAKKNQDGSYTDTTEWHFVVCFGKTAEFCGKYLQKGATCLVEGRLQTRHYEKDGHKHYVTEVIASRVEALKLKQDAKPRQQTQQDNLTDYAPEPQFNPDEEIPF